MNLNEKIAKIRNLVEMLQKDAKGYNYKYVPDYAVLAKITAGLSKYKVDVYPSVVPGTAHFEPISYTRTKLDRNKNLVEESVNEVIVSADMKFEWVDLENPEDRFVSDWYMVGQQPDSSQAFGSALTYSIRYYLLKFFKSSTTNDDPDFLRHEQDEAFAKSYINEVDALAKENVTEENKAGFVKIVKKYAKDDSGKASSNYFYIGNAADAEKLLKETVTYFNNTNTEEKE